MVKLDRRTFLKVSAVTGTAAAVAPRLLKAMEEELRQNEERHRSRAPWMRFSF